MKITFLLSSFAIGACLLAGPAHGQVMLQRAVISTGGAASSNAAMSMGSTAGQPVVGVASNGQIVAHFGFWTPAAGAAAVQPEAMANRLSIEAWPNPASDGSKITVTLPYAASLDVRLYDVTGAQVRDIYAGAANGSRAFDVDLSGLPAGSYIVAARIPGQLVERRISVIR